MHERAFYFLLEVKFKFGKRIFCDSLNLYKESHRIHVEQAFGMFISRWSLSCSPLHYQLVDNISIL